MKRKGCAGPIGCHLDRERNFVRCGRLGHADPNEPRAKFAIVKLYGGGWALYPPQLSGLRWLRGFPRYRFTSHADAVEAMNLAVAACG